MGKTILVTGGAVHAHLDAVKIITNQFRGGRMAKLAADLNEQGHTIIYLTSKTGVHPIWKRTEPTMVIIHDGFDDYQKKVVELAPQVDAVILGAAVCNLIPLQHWEGKFPSHQYKPGDLIPLNFTIAPRVIDEVKKANPKAKLFGFKLLKGVPYEELIDAAYDVVLTSGAVAVFANDANNLDKKFAVTKEKSVIPMTSDEMVRFILQAIDDQYYTTTIVSEMETYMQDILERPTGELYRKLLDKYAPKFVTVNNIVFGTIAVRWGSTGSFITTARGKKDLNAVSFVSRVNYGFADEGEPKYGVFAGPVKPTLNAPLLYHIFLTNPDVKAIIHYHEDVTNNLPWAPPGTVRDSMRNINSSFGIDHHGRFLLLRENEL